MLSTKATTFANNSGPIIFKDFFVISAFGQLHPRRRYIIHNSYNNSRALSLSNHLDEKLLHVRKYSKQAVNRQRGARLTRESQGLPVVRRLKSDSMFFPRAMVFLENIHDTCAWTPNKVYKVLGRWAMRSRLDWAGLATLAGPAGFLGLS